MILDKKLNGILSQEDRALKIFEPSESDKLYDVSFSTITCSFLWSICRRKVGSILSFNLSLPVLFELYHWLEIFLNYHLGCHRHDRGNG